MKETKESRKERAGWKKHPTNEEALSWFWSCVRPNEDGCFLWVGHTVHGYGYVRIQGRVWRAHRFAYTVLRGEIPGGLTLDHLCRNRACVNPYHLEPVTNKENILRGVGISAENARKIICHHGHELTNRKCLVCRRAFYMKWYWNGGKHKKRLYEREQRGKARASANC